MELWGGIECTLNRVGNKYIDQFERSGHLHRKGDLKLIADLGIRKMRYPIHWERVQPTSPRKYDWSFADRQCEEMATVGIEPIFGLLHHGSGPIWTDLLQPDFPQRLADFAFAVAQRFPDVRDYTPVNEPLTTARFSALYGHWYPHRKDDRSFAQALLNEIEGTLRSMEAIRLVRADARLIQTEDIAKVFSTSHLADQAAFENQRRWITFDMLSGRFGKAHPLWDFIRGTGVDETQLQFIADHPVRADVLGINYYVTSERWLDENLSRHPLESHGGNGRDSYADVAAVQGCPNNVLGIEGLAREVWNQYGSPLAITECHLGCTRDEQLRWLMETWQACEKLQEEGVDLQAVTVWALLGAFDWNSLVTRQTGVYEPGPFDVRGMLPRPTQLAKAVRSLAQTSAFEHPVLNKPGWWSRSEGSFSIVLGEGRSRKEGAPLVILGGSGNLGRALKRVCHTRGLPCRNLTRYEADVCDPKSLRLALECHRPWAVVNASGYTIIDNAETDRERCFEINEAGAANAAQVCAIAGLPYVAVSSDLVFDGSKSGAYLEGDEALPLNVYGESKLCGERAILRSHPGALVIRTSPLFDPWSATHFAAQLLMREDDDLVLPQGRISPTYTIDLCHALLDLLVDDESGIWHLANIGAVTWTEFAERLLETFQLPARQILGEAAVASRPKQSVLSSGRGSMMPSLEHAMSRFANDFQPMLRSSREHRIVVAA